jgi:hypothetical protein
MARGNGNGNGNGNGTGQWSQGLQCRARCTYARSCTEAWRGTPVCNRRWDIRCLPDMNTTSPTPDAQHD